MARVLSIGQCGPDHGSISSFLIRQFGAETVPAVDLDHARRLLDPKPALVLVNRKLDVDYSDGMDVIRALKDDPATKDLPVMLVSNYPEYHDEAVKLGAVPGFGKAELGRAETAKKLEPYLGNGK
jgi:CheY-like chemotaxis protein